MKRPPAPVYVDTFDLCRWLLERFRDSRDPLPRRICRDAIELLRAVTLALSGRRREAHLEAADERLIALRTELRLAGACGYLRDPQMLHGLERADGVGRQLGGWIRALDAE